MKRNQSLSTPALLGFLMISLAPGLLIAQKARTRVACVGDSITEGAGLGDSTYPESLQRIMGEGYLVRNYGLGGRTLLKKGDYPYWKEKAFRQVQSWQPGLVVIMLGTNDSKPWNWKYGSDFEGNYAAFIQTFRKLPSHPAIYVCLPVPVFRNNYGIRDSIVKGVEPSLIREAVRREKVNLIDLYKPMLPYGRYFPDGVHPNQVGAWFMAKAIYRKIRHFRHPAS